MRDPRPGRLMTCAAALWLCCGAALAAEEKTPRKEITVCGEKLRLLTGEEVKARGFPWVDVADEDNAAADYIKGANVLHQTRAPETPDEQREHAIAHGWDDGMKELAAALEARKAALDHYRQGASKTLCQLPFGKARMLAGMLLPSLGKARQAARLLCVQARRFEAKGQFRRAVDNYLAVIRIGQHYGTGRTLIDQLVGIACITIGTDAAFTGICRHHYPRKELERLMAELAARRPHMPEFAHAMRSERAFGLGTIDDLMRLGPEAIGAITAVHGEEWPASPSPLQARLVRILLPDRTVKKDMAAFYNRSIAAARKPYYTKDARRDLMPGGKPWNILAHMLLPALSRARTATEKCKAKAALLGLAVAVKIYQQDVGVYPDSLRWLLQDKILKKLPDDPFSGKPYKYKLKDGDFVLYSVCDNLKDDGGKIGRGDGPSGFLDYGFTSKLPPKKAYRP